MPTFNYKAKEGPVKIIDGTIEASNVDNAIYKIIQLGLTPIDVAEQIQQERRTKKTGLRLSWSFIKRVKLTDIVQFTRQMTDLVEAYVPLLRALQIVSHQTQNPIFRSIIEQMSNFVRDGGSFSEALAQHPNIFSKLYVSMIKTGEVGGELGGVLNRLAIYLEKELQTRSKIRSSLAYPMLILIVGTIIVFVLLTFVIPRLSILFDDLDQELPAMTLILVRISRFLSKSWWLILGMMVMGGAYFKQWISTTSGRLWFDIFRLKIPLLGHFMKIVEVGRFARTLGTLIESGVVITAALSSVWSGVENLVLRDELKKASEEVTNGSSLKNALKACSFFPEMAVNIIAVGEETGHLERGLYKVAEMYEQQSDQAVKTMLSLFGPLVLVVVVLIIGFFVIAMLLPLFKMNSLIL